MNYFFIHDPVELNKIQMFALLLVLQKGSQCVCVCDFVFVFVFVFVRVRACV